MSIWKSKCVLFLEVVGRVRRCTKSKYNEKWTYMHPKDTLDAIWKFRQLLTIDHGFWISTIITYSNLLLYTSRGLEISWTAGLCSFNPKPREPRGCFPTPNRWKLWAQYDVFFLTSDESHRELSGWNMWTFLSFFYLFVPMKFIGTVWSEFKSCSVCVFWGDA